MANEQEQNPNSLLPDELATSFLSKYGDKLETIENDEPTPEEIAAQAAELGGSSFNEQGDLLDEAGEILKTKDELENTGSSQSAGKKPKGNEQDDDTKGDDEDEVSFTESLLDGLELEEDELEGIDLKSNDSETVKKVIEIRENKVKEKALKELFDTDSEIEEFVKHKAQGLSLDSFKQKKQAEVFNANFELDEDNVKQHEEIVRAAYEAQNIKGKKLEAIIETLKDDDELFTEAKAIVDTQKQAALKQANERIAQEKEQQASLLKEQQTAIKEVETVLAKRKLDDRVVLTPEAANQLKEFALSDKREQKWSKLSTEQMLLIDYLVMTDFNFKGLEKQAVKKVLPQNNKKVIIGSKTGSEQEPQEMSYNELMNKLKQQNRN